MKKQIKKIAIVIADFNIGGAQKVVLDLLKAVDTQKYQVKLFVHEEKKENQFTTQLDALGICAEYVTRQRGLTLGNYCGLAKALNAFAPDLIHIHLDTVYAPVWALLHKNVRSVFTLHSQPHRAFDGTALRMLHSMLARRKWYTLCACARTVAQETEALLNLKPGTVHTVYNPVDVGEMPCRTQGTETCFVHVARFHPVKNHKLLIDAFAELLKTHPDCILQLAGDGKLKGQYEDYVQQMGLHEKIRFLGNVQDVKTLLKQSDVFVLSSDSEAMPISVLEAMAQGLPIISTRVGGVPELIDGNGILTEKGNLPQLTMAMAELAVDSEKRRIYGKRSYEMAREFSAERIMEKYEKLYLRIE